MKKHRKNKNAPPPGLPPESEQPVEEQPKKQPFLKRLLFGEETPDLSELEAGSLSCFYKTEFSVCVNNTFIASFFFVTTS